MPGSTHTYEAASPRCIRSPGAAGVFPPEQIDHLQELLHQAPPAYCGDGPAPARRSLKYLRGACSQLADYSLSGIWRLLDAMRISYERGRQHLHSPEADYVSKRDRAKACEDEARTEPARVVTPYLDEMSYYRRPTMAKGWADGGSGKQALAEMGYKSNTGRRVVAAMEVVTGKVI